MSSSNVEPAKCDDRSERHPYPFCVYEMMLDTQKKTEGLNFTNVEKILMDFSYEGSAKSVRLHAKNFDPRYSTPGDPVGLKFLFNDASRSYERSEPPAT